MEPTPVVRAVTYERDGHRCVSCGAMTGLQYQHRQATGMGGSKVRPRFEEGVTSCGSCNPRYESDLQVKALAFGWKVPRWVSDAALVPVFFWIERAWFLLGRDGTRVQITFGQAWRSMVEVYGEEQYVEWEKAA